MIPTLTYKLKKLEDFALQSLTKGKKTITTLGKTSLKKRMLFYQEITRLLKMVGQHTLNKINIHFLY